MICSYGIHVQEGRQRETIPPRYHRYGFPVSQAGGKKGPPDYAAAQHIKGRKRRILVDTGELLPGVVTDADIQDGDGAVLVCAFLRQQFTR